MSYKTVLKRDGSETLYDEQRIRSAIERSLRAAAQDFEALGDLAKESEELTQAVEADLEERGVSEPVEVEQIQDSVESVLLAKNPRAAYKFVNYRERHKILRDNDHTLVDVTDTIEGYIDHTQWREKENANAGRSFASLLNFLSGTCIAKYWLKNKLPAEIANAHRNGAFHIHDLSAAIVGYCAGWSLRDVLEKGFLGKGSRASAAPAKHFDSACAQASNFLATLQTEWAGAQALSSFDTLLAPFIRADHLSYKEVKQTIQRYIFSLNISTRWGQCVPVTTQCLRDNGSWASVDELKIGDPILVYDIDSGELKTDTLTHITRKPYKGKLHVYRNFSGGSLSVTPEHRILHSSVEDDYKFVLTPSSELTKRPVTNMLVSMIMPGGCSDGSRPYMLNSQPFLRSETDYDGEVWCPTTSTGTFIAKTETGLTVITGNSPFTNITLDWNVPDDLKDQPVIIGGEFQEETYSEFQPEMDMLNRAFLETMLEGDKNGGVFTFPIPTYNITGHFNWDADENSNEALLFRVAGKYGTPYFQNFVNSDLNPSDVRSMCCRLRLDLKELRKKTGGLFGAGEQTGSVGVVTINLPRIGYLSSKSGEGEEGFYRRLFDMMDLAKRSLEIKREEVLKNYECGLMPYTTEYLPSLDHHFLTIGIVGMNECCRNLFGEDLMTDRSQEFAKDVLRRMRERLAEYQEETGHLYNLEASPAESASYRMAKEDKARYPDILTAGVDVPYYTNSTQLPVDATSDLFEALDHQDELQTLYNGGTVFHAFLGEPIEDWKQVRDLVRTITSQYKLPNFSITPTFSICPDHGYIPGRHETCPKCIEVEDEQ